MKCYVCYEQPYDCYEPEKIFWYRKDAEAWVKKGDNVEVRTDNNGRQYEIDAPNYRTYKEMEIE